MQGPASATVRAILARMSRGPDPDGQLARVRALCLALPAVTESPTHGAPTWFVNGRRSFAKYVDPALHRVDEPEPALWAAAPPGARHELVAADPGRFFGPPFGGSGWVGMRLGGAEEAEVSEILEDAYRQVAPRYLVERIGRPAADGDPSPLPGGPA